MLTLDFCIQVLSTYINVLPILRCLSASGDSKRVVFFFRVKECSSPIWRFFALSIRNAIWTFTCKTSNLIEAQSVHKVSYPREREQGSKDHGEFLPNDGHRERVEDKQAGIKVCPTRADASRWAGQKRTVPEVSDKSLLHLFKVFFNSPPALKLTIQGQGKTKTNFLHVRSWDQALVLGPPPLPHQGRLCVPIS